MNSDGICIYIRFQSLDSIFVCLLHIPVCDTSMHVLMRRGPGKEHPKRLRPPLSPLVPSLRSS